MKPVIHVVPIIKDNNILDSITKTIGTIDCSEYFHDHLGKSQEIQKEIVSSFQKNLHTKLSAEIKSVKWIIEHIISTSSRDVVDIFGLSDDGTIVIIELDKYRADQVAKKFVSRTVITQGNKIFYISLCYPGTQRMNHRECVKYFSYCANISKRLGNIYAGFIIE